MNYTPNINICQVLFYNSGFFVLDMDFRHMMNEIAAVSNAVTQNAFHTPSGQIGRAHV